MGLELLTVVFIVLKLVGVIAWSWWWVLAPTWIPLALFLVGATYLVKRYGWAKVRFRYPWSRK